MFEDHGEDGLQNFQGLALRKFSQDIQNGARLFKLEIQFEPRKPMDLFVGYLICKKKLAMIYVKLPRYTQLFLFFGNLPWQKQSYESIHLMDPSIVYPAVRRKGFPSHAIGKHVAGFGYFLGLGMILVYRWRILSEIRKTTLDTGTKTINNKIMIYIYMTINMNWCRLTLESCESGKDGFVNCVLFSLILKIKNHSIRNYC